MTRTVVTCSVGILLGTLLSATGVAKGLEPGIPSLADVRAAYRPSDARLLDRHGEVIHELRVDATQRRLTWVPLSAVSAALQAAVIASEDRRFCLHGGVDWKALLAAAWQDIAHGDRRGASTISMQLASLLDPGLGRAGGRLTPLQKWRQMRAAWAIERRWSKAEILEAYLNLVTFRGELQGVGAAASVLYAKAPHGITVPEALVLAVLLRAPSAPSPIVVQRAVALGTRVGGADDDAVAAAGTRALQVRSGTGPRVQLAPHVAHQLLRPSDPSHPVSCTLDAAVQRVAFDSLRRNLLAVRERRVEDGAVLVADNASGDVLAYVGSSGDLSSARFVDGVQARRQAGSALKPFLYGWALDQRLLTAASLVEDTPLELAVAGGLYRPDNYDEQFRGMVSVRTALAASLNVPAVRTLGLVGADAFVHVLRRLGFGLRESGDYYGPALALGSADVSLWEMVNAYRALANGGVSGPLRLRDDAAVTPGQEVYTAPAAFLVSDILSDRGSRTTTFGMDNPLATRYWAAVKTGTSKDMRDNWCVGYSQRYTVGVWVGNFTGAPMQDVSGVTGAAPVWRELMDWLHRDVPSHAPSPPPELVTAHVTFLHGVESDRGEWFIAGTAPDLAPTNLAAVHPTITAPVSGTIIALDPDIPAARQRIAFESHAAARHMRWYIDGTDLGPATTLALWVPRPGAHTLAIVDAGQTVEAARFLVRGRQE